MTFEIGLLLGIIFIAMILFSTEWVEADVVALGIMLSLLLTRILKPEQAFLGFGSDTVMLILGLLILTAALLRTGVVDMAARAILRHNGEDPHRLLLVIMIAVAVLSAFISNTAATAFFLPIVFDIASRTKQSVSKFLMPLAFASILTSAVTLVSTSSNIVVSDLMKRAGLEPLGMFELAPVGLPITVVGLLYMWFLGRRLIPNRGGGQDETNQFGLKPYLTEVLVLPGSPLAGKSLAEAGLGRDLDLTVLRVVRDKDRYLAPTEEMVLEPGDALLVEGSREDILKVKDTAGIDIKLSDPELPVEDLALVEAILPPTSPLIGRTLKSFRFREQYGLQVLAIHRAGGTIRRKISKIPLKMGDVLILQSHRANVRAHAGSDVFRILGAIEDTRPNPTRARIAVGIFVATLALGTFNVLGVSMPVAVLLGALGVFLTRCITPKEAYRQVEWKVVILIGCMLALGIAMTETGTEKFIASGIVRLVGSAGPRWILTGFFVLTVLLTQPMSNQAAAIVVVPIAIQTARQLDLNPRTFAMMVAVAATCSYLTPLEPSCLMVYGPGRYRFMDFVKVGGLLTVLIYVVAIILVPLRWPLHVGSS